MKSAPRPEPKTASADVVLLQPGFAHYRTEIFQELSRRHDLVCVYTRALKTYPGSERPEGYRFLYAEGVSALEPLAIFLCLLRLRPKVVVAANAGSVEATIARLYTALFGRRFVLWILEWRNPDFANGSAWRRLLRRVKFIVSRANIRGCDALIAMGSAARDYAISLGTHVDRIFTTVNWSVDIGSASDAAVRAATTHGGFTFLYLGRIIDWKGLDHLLRAFAMLEKERADVRLVVAGDGPFKEECSHLARSLGLRRVEFVGSVDPTRLGEQYIKADVFVLPSCVRNNAYEAWGLVVNEAMSMSLPIIATTAVGAAHDMVEEAGNGFVVAEGSDRALYEAMSKILGLDLAAMGRRSRQIFAAKNRVDAVVAAFDAAIGGIPQRAGPD